MVQIEKATQSLAFIPVHANTRDQPVNKRPITLPSRNNVKI